VYDRSGSYDLALQLILGVLTIAMLAALLLRVVPVSTARAAAT
jgi:hypothetical protein